MGWFTCYKLLEQYGSRDAIPPAEIAWANRTNPNTPADAWRLAERKFAENKDGRRRFNEAVNAGDLRDANGQAIKEDEHETNR